MLLKLHNHTTMAVNWYNRAYQPIYDGQPTPPSEKTIDEAFEKFVYPGDIKVQPPDTTAQKYWGLHANNGNTGAPLYVNDHSTNFVGKAQGVTAISCGNGQGVDALIAHYYGKSLLNS